MTLNVNEIFTRAEQAAAAPDATDSAPALPVIACTLAGELYGVPLAETREVARLGQITPVPGLPPVLLGAVNLRGEVLPVADLRLLLGLAAAQETSAARLIVVGRASGRAGLLVDAIGDVLDMALNEPGQNAADLVAAQGVLPDGRLLNLLNVGGVLAALQEA